MSRFESGFICITGVDMRAFVKAVYELSSPQGMGYIQFVEGDMPEPLLDQVMSMVEKRADDSVALSLDYVAGRACKMTVFRDTAGGLHITDRWFDHELSTLIALLDRVGIRSKLSEKAA